jgi:putative DNA primase/helicase
MSDEKKVVAFPATTTQGDPDEQFRRVKVEAERLANQSQLERGFWLPQRAEEIGVSVAVLKNAVDAVLRERMELKAAERRAEAQNRKDLSAKQREEKHAQERAVREEEKRERYAEQEAERAKKRAKQEAERKAKLKVKAFGNLAKVPTARHEDGLAKLASQLGEELAALRAEFKDFLGVDTGDAAAVEQTEPWPEQVDTAKLLTELGNKARRYVAMQEYQLDAAVLWAAHAWLYDYDVPTHSPILAATSAEPDSGKSTLVAVLGRATPRFSLNIEMTGPALYRYVDAVKPTLGIDEADDLFARRSDLKHIVNAGWTRGLKVPRQVNFGGVSRTVHFDPFTPKMIALLGQNLPPATRSRFIELRMLPKRHDEKVETFNQRDDADFAILRRKFARWAADNADKLRNAQPTIPDALNNRAATNWGLLLAIADLAGGPWPKRARDAAERLTRTGRQPSHGVQLLTAFKQLFGDGRKFITSEDMVEFLLRDKTDVWIDYNHGGPITQRQVAILLKPYGIHPVSLHPKGHRDYVRRGYRASQFDDAFARYVPDDPLSRSLGGRR